MGSVDRNFAEGSADAIPEDGIFQFHPGAKLEDVMPDYLNKYPDDSFCFLNVGKLRERARQVQDHFLPEEPGRVIAYAVKANPRPHLLRALWGAGITHFDCASTREIDLVKRVLPGAKIFFNHPIKSPSSIAHAAGHGVAHYTAQSQREIEKVLSQTGGVHLLQPVEIAVRLQTLNDAADVNLSEKYGAPEADVRRMIHSLRDEVTALPGISAHAGSQNRNPCVYADTVKRMCDIAVGEGGVKTINVGGGIPVNYHADDRFDLREYLQIISSALRMYAPPALLDDPKIIIELGRSLVAESVDLTIPVIAVEDRGRRRIYINDGVFTSFSDSPIHNWKYHFECIGKDGRKISGGLVPTMVFGRTCDSGDNLGIVMLPEDLQEGDFLLVQNAGAYLDSQSSSFNGFEPPKYVAYNSGSLMIEPDGSRLKAAASTNPYLLDLGNIPYIFESRDSSGIDRAFVGEVSNAFRYTFNNVFPEFALCRACDVKLRAYAALGTEEGKLLPLETLDSLTKMPCCPSCDVPMQLFHDPDTTEKLLAKKLAKDGYITVLRSAADGAIGAFTFAYERSLREVFQYEWKNRYAYTRGPDSTPQRSFDVFLDAVKRCLANHPHYSSMDEAVDAETSVVCWNCVVVGPLLQGTGVLPKLMRNFTNHVPAHAMSKPVIGETIEGSRFHQILERAGQVSVPNVLDPGYVLSIGQMSSLVKRFRLPPEQF